LASQFATLEPPEASEPVVTVSIDAPVEAIIEDILRQLQLTPADSTAARRNRS
jgi:gluconokinase